MVLNSCACRDAEGAITRHQRVLDKVTAMAEPWTAASYGYAERKNYCELGMERMSTRTACSPSTRSYAWLRRRRSRTAANELVVRRPESAKTRTETTIPGSPA